MPDDQLRALVRAIDEWRAETTNVDQKFSALEGRLRAVEIGILNEIAMQSRRTTRVEERLNRVEGAA